MQKEIELAKLFRELQRIADLIEKHERNCEKHRRIERAYRRVSSKKSRRMHSMFWRIRKRQIIDSKRKLRPS